MQKSSDTVHFPVVGENENNKMVRTSLRRSMSCERREVCVSCDGSGRRGGGCVSCDGGGRRGGGYVSCDSGRRRGCVSCDGGGRRRGGCVSCDGSGRRGGWWRAKQVFFNSLES